MPFSLQVEVVSWSLCSLNSAVTTLWNLIQKQTLWYPKFFKVPWSILLFQTCCHKLFTMQSWFLSQTWQVMPLTQLKSINIQHWPKTRESSRFGCWGKLAKTNYVTWKQKIWVKRKNANYEFWLLEMKTWVLNSQIQRCFKSKLLKLLTSHLSPKWWKHCFKGHVGHLSYCASLLAALAFLFTNSLSNLMIPNAISKCQNKIASNLVSWLWSEMQTKTSTVGLKQTAKICKWFPQAVLSK